MIVLMIMGIFTRQNVHQPLKKSPMRGGKSDAGGPGEKQLNLFVCPYIETVATSYMTSIVQVMLII